MFKKAGVFSVFIILVGLIAFVFVAYYGNFYKEGISGRVSESVDSGDFKEINYDDVIDYEGYYKEAREKSVFLYGGLVFVLSFMIVVVLLLLNYLKKQVL